MVIQGRQLYKGGLIERIVSMVVVGRGGPSLGVQPGFEAASLAWRRSPARDTKPGRTARFQVGIPNQWDFQLVGSLERGSAFGGKLGVQ